MAGRPSAMQKGRHILHDLGEAAHNRHFADAHELVNAHETPDHALVFDGDVARNSGRIGNQVTVAQNAVVPEMNVGHQQIVVAHHRRLALAGRAVNRHHFAQHVVVAQFDERFLALELQVLRLAAQNYVRHQTAIFAQSGAALDDDVGLQSRPSADARSALDNAKRADLDVLPDFGTGINDGQSMNFGAADAAVAIAGIAATTVAGACAEACAGADATTGAGTEGNAGTDNGADIIAGGRNGRPVSRRLTVW